jgi:predicted alpha/beta-fold hydrolase
VTGNPNITVIVTDHGGHCGFVERPAPGYDGYWAEREIVRFADLLVMSQGSPAPREAC